MTIWRDKLMEQIEPETIYFKGAIPLSAAPIHYVKILPDQILGRDLIESLLRYLPIRGRKRVANPRVQRIQLRCSKQEREFLERISSLYRVNISSIIRGCCLGMPMYSHLPPTHLELLCTLGNIKSTFQQLSNRNGFHDIEELLDEAIYDLKKLREIKPPLQRKPKDQPRLTVRFTKEEWESMNFERFSVYAWGKILGRRWFTHKRIDSYVLDKLQGIGEKCSWFEYHNHEPSAIQILGIRAIIEEVMEVSFEYE